MAVVSATRHIYSSSRLDNIDRIFCCCTLDRDCVFYLGWKLVHSDVVRLYESPIALLRRPIVAWYVVDIKFTPRDIFDILADCYVGSDARRVRRFSA